MTPQEVTFLNFEDWVLFIFDHPAEGPEWFADPEAPFWNAPSALTLAYVTRLFETAPAHLEGFTDAEINKGLWYLLSPGLGEHMTCLDDPGLPLAALVHGVRACFSVFRDLLQPRCSSHLSHKNWEGAAPLNSVCYMWWEIMPVYGGPIAAERQVLQEAAIDTMREILQLPALACQESALHGLGHWRAHNARRVENIIDAYLASQMLCAELADYARAARCGCVL